MSQKSLIVHLVIFISYDLEKNYIFIILFCYFHVVLDSVVSSREPRCLFAEPFIFVSVSGAYFICFRHEERPLPGAI